MFKKDLFFSSFHSALHSVLVLNYMSEVDKMVKNTRLH